MTKLPQNNVSNNSGYTLKTKFYRKKGYRLIIAAHFRCNIYDNISVLDDNSSSLHKFDCPELHINAVFNLPKLSNSLEFFRVQMLLSYCFWHQNILATASQNAKYNISGISESNSTVVVFQRAVYFNESYIRRANVNYFKYFISRGQQEGTHGHGYMKYLTIFSLPHPRLLLLCL